MSSTQQDSSIVAKRYANALIELADESKKLDKVEKDFGDLAAMIQDSDDLHALILSPVHSKAASQKAVFAIADKAKFQDITKNFLGVLVENGRLNILPSILRAFNKTLDGRRGAITIDVEVAQDMSAKQKKDLQAALSKAIGKDVAVNARVEPSILGGMIVTVGSHMIDDSVRRKLERLKVSVGAVGGANENVELKEVS